MRLPVLRTPLAAALALGAVLILSPSSAGAAGPEDPAGAAGGAGAAAQPVPPAPPHGRILLTVGGRDRDGAWLRWVELVCPGESREHPRARDACRELAPVRGEIRRLERADRPCTREYDPVTATANGHWGDRPIAWHETFGNACELRARTGSAFAF